MQSICKFLQISTNFDIFVKKHLKSVIMSTMKDEAQEVIFGYVSRVSSARPKDSPILIHIS